MKAKTALVTLTDTGTVDATEALRKSVLPILGSADFFAIASEQAIKAYGDLGFTPSAPYNDTDLLVSDVLTESGQCAFALPRVIESLLESYEACVFIGAGLLLVGDPTPLITVAEMNGVGLFRPTSPSQPTSLLPRIRALERLDPVVDTRVVAVTRGASRFVADWKATMYEAVLDVKQRNVDWFGSEFIATAFARSDVAVGGSQISRVTDYGSGTWESGVGEPCIALCDELFSVTRFAGDDEDEFERLWQSATAKVDDTDLMDQVLATIEETAHLYNKNLSPTPFDVFCDRARRALDPFGRTWGPADTDEFRTWLFDENEAGQTRVANMTIMDDPDLYRDFADAKYDPTEFRKWAATEGLSQLGFDPFHQSTEPFHPDVDAGTDDGQTGGNPFLWRWNTLKSMIPGYGRRLWDRSQRKLIGLPSIREGELKRPKAIETVLPPSAWGVSPRELNVVGLFRSESGLGQAARATLQALNLLGRPFSHVDTSEMYPSRNSVRTGLSWETYGQTGDVNLLHANADELLTMRDTAFNHRLGAQFNIGVWFWETADLPERSRGAFAAVDELWVASRYLQDVFGQYGRVPVRVIGLAADLPEERDVDREELGWQEGELVFLFAYDALSSHGRKNPSAAINAFKKAFGPEYDGVRLVLKASNLGKFVRAKHEIETLTADCDAIELIDRYLTREHVLDLMAASDVYVSLHAAEGFGLTILESMAMGTPAICTGYSGNMDFTTEENSWLIDYDLTRIQEPTGPYPAGSVWASPRVEQAADVMRQIKEQASMISAKGKLARADALEAASLEGYAKRLNEQLQRVL